MREKTIHPHQFEEISYSMVCPNWPKCLRNYAAEFHFSPKLAKMLKELCGIDDMVLHLIWSKKNWEGKVVQNYLFSNENFLEKLIRRHLTLQKTILPKSFPPKWPNSAKTLKKLCEIDEMVFHLIWCKKNW